MKTFRSLAALALLVMGVHFCGSPAHASVIATFVQDGSNVDASITGTINMAGLVALGPAGLRGFVNSSITRFAIGTTIPSSVYAYGGLSTTSGSPFLSAPLAFATSGSGGPFGLVDGSVLWIPTGYSSGGTVQANSVFSNKTLDDLGLKEGTYRYTWGAGANADFMTLQIGTPAPEPSSIAFISLGLSAIGLTIRRRRKAEGKNSFWADAES